MEVKNWDKLFKGRVLWLYVLVVFLFAAIVVKQAWIQCLHSEYFKLEASDTQQRIRAQVGETLGARGDIRDRNYQVLATSAIRRSINSHPWQVKDPQRTTDLLAPILEMDRAELFEILSSDATFVTLKYKAPDSMCDAVLKLQQDLAVKNEGLPPEKQDLSLSAIEVARENSGLRYYPKGRLASHILGIVGGEEDGLEGIEAVYDRELSPKVHSDQRPLDVFGNVIPTAPSFAELSSEERKDNPEILDGSTVVLTIDERVQFIVERELEKQVKAMHAKGGICVVLDARTADVLAMAVYPDFEPARYSKYSPAVRRNRAISDFYEPGSIFKVFLAGIALANGYQAKSTFYCPGRLIVDGWPIYNADDGLYTKGTETIADIIAYSFNTGTASVAMELGSKKLGQGLATFGVGQATGIEFLGESEGMIDDWRTWARSRLATISFGQGVAVTPMQLVSAMQAVANDGVRLRPHLVKEVVSPTGERTTYKPEVLSKPLTKAQAKEMREVLAGVVSFGSGKRARVPGYRVGGKTGTAEVPGPQGGYAEGKYVAGFLGMAPIDRPEVVVLVKIEEPWPLYYGGLAAAPLFNHVCSKILPVLGVPPKPGFKQVDPVTGL